MDPAVVAWGVVAALIAAGGTYVLAAKKMSGRIGTSDAGQLWAESAAIRADYQARLIQADERSRSLEIRMAKAEEQNSLLSRENYELRHEIADCRQLVAAQTRTIARLQAEAAKEGSKHVDDA